MLTKLAIHEFMAAVEDRLGSPARLYLVGESSLVVEGWREWTDQVVYTAVGADLAQLTQTLEGVAAQQGIRLVCESPADVIPLPHGHERRARGWQIGGRTSPARLELFHFDPYSTAIRLIARGDEPDYMVVLAFLRLGWIQLSELDRLLAELLPKFSAETLQQDPAEFRRKYKGLRQMWLAPGAGSGSLVSAANGQAGSHSRLQMAGDAADDLI
jgi:hypothetical protein